MIQKNLPYILLVLGAAIILYMNYNHNTGCCNHAHAEKHDHSHKHTSSCSKNTADKHHDHNHKHEPSCAKAPADKHEHDDNQ